MENNNVQRQTFAQQPIQDNPFAQGGQTQANVPNQNLGAQQSAQPFQQPQQSQNFNQQQQFVQHAAPRQMMSMEKRALLLALCLIGLFLLLSDVTSLYSSLKNHVADSFHDILLDIYTNARYIVQLSALILGVLFFVPQWNKKVFEYANTRIFILSIACMSIILSVFSFITTIGSSLRINAENAKYASLDGAIFQNVFSSNYIFIPLFIGLAIFTLILALSLPKNKLRKDRFSIGLLTAITTTLSTGFILLIFSFFASY